MSSKDNDDKQLIHSKTNNIETMISNEANQIIKLSELLLNRFQLALEESMKDSYFVYDRIDGMHYKCNKMSLNRSDSIQNLLFG